ncbi:signal peptidase I [Streptococcus loxodontisalivarius]|uniref:Signal peptidase I n=1 Tax=Streptococcus loxodontisalivarius TaxID=1349415 RepID=A0ABS2PSM8_9STRE|nr:signal peptidase I [Streptococcus loxodontisalivarius]MBM7642715.1 signal peptidase I [Streptococcus loxodontisalivarius]
MKKFLKDWAFTIIIVFAAIVSRLFIWFPVTVEGHSMDPTLADGQRLVVVKTSSIQRFDVVVAEETEDGQTKQIVKRVIGMPGDTIKYENDTLYVNGEKVDESYLDDYIAAFKKDKLQSTYSYNSYFQERAEAADAFTTDTDGNASFEVTVPEGQYYLLGDDRIVSKDSREVGTFSRSAIVGEVKFRYWTLDKFGTID